ncbi:MAG TPA: ribonuclease E/G, partial [Beijerinckiaceae bacterium]|nr:ribonuclease E/G [Beijerinckiaceae bacterium]
RELENRFGVTITVVADNTLPATSNFALDRAEPALRSEPRATAVGVAAGVQAEAVVPVDEPIEVEPTELAGEEAGDTAHEDEAAGEGGEGGGRRRRRRRRRRGRGGDGRDSALHAAGSAHDDFGAESDEDAEAEDDAAPEDLSHEPDASERRNQLALDETRTAAEATEAPPSRPEREAAFANGPILEPANLNATPEPDMREPDVRQSEPRQPEPRQPAEPEPIAVVLTPPDPDRPKRAGWWSKAKAAITGS